MKKLTTDPMKIDVTTIDRETGHCIDTVLPCSWISDYFEEEDEARKYFREDFRLKISLFFAGDILLGRGEWSTTLSLNCDRCLEKYSHPFNHFFEISFFPLEESNKEEIIPAENEFYYLEDELDMLKIIGELVSLNLPYLKLCRENCKGICQACGKNKNLENCNCRDIIYPTKFEKLKNLKIGG